MKASSLLPLNVPIGKPILSCNATELLQAQINLNGVIYDCDRSAITMSCPRMNENNLVVDDCRGETLECDVRMAQNSQSVSCTNGTLISNHPIVCKSATLMERKNVLNCVYKNKNDGNLQTPTQLPSHPTPRPETNYQITETPEERERPLSTPHTSLIPPPPVEENQEKVNELDVRTSFNKNQQPPLQDLGLAGEVKQAMTSVFPYELLSIASSKMYLPPKSSGGQLPEDLKDHLEGVFPHELFAASEADDLNTNEVKSADNQFAEGLSLRRKEDTDRSSIPQNLQSQWSLNVGNPSGSIKTSSNRLMSRFGEENADTEDRLIFSP